MGNQLSNGSPNNRIGYPNPQLKFKVGDKIDPIPCPSAVSKSNYQSLYNDLDFKDYVFQNLHSNHFINSILQNSSDESIVMEGIRYFLPNNREVRSELNNDVKKFQDFIISGLQASLPTTIQICEKDLEFHKNSRSSPYIRSVQCRLAVVREMESAILLERKRTQERSLSHRVTTISLNSSDHPHLAFIYPLMLSGISFIQMIPLLLTTSPSHNNPSLFQPFQVLSQQFLTIPDLNLFKCWSPAPRPPLKKLTIDRHMISSNIGDPMRAINDTQHQYWSCSSKGGALLIHFDVPTSVVSLSITWGPQPSSSMTAVACGAPKKLHIFIRRSNNGSSIEQLKTIDIDEERKRTRSWIHEYDLEIGDNIFDILLQPEGLSIYNQSTVEPIKIYSLSLFSEESNAIWFDTMPLLHNFQKVLYSLHSVDVIENDMYCTLFTLPRISGSLLLILDLIEYLEDHNPLSKFQVDSQRYHDVWGCIHQLISAIRKVHLQLQESVIVAIASHESTKNITKITFDENAKSADMTLTEDGRVITCNSGGNSYGLVDCEMENGIWEWEITIIRDNHGDETSCLGVARRPVTNCNYDTTSDMWLIRCYNGDTYHCGRLPKKRSIPHIHPNDICKFRFDSESRTLSLSVNDVDVGVIFDNLDSGISPAVSFYGSGKSIKLLNLRQIQNNKYYDGLNTSDLGSISSLPSINQLQSSNYDVVAGILSHLSELTNLHLLLLNTDDTTVNISTTTSTSTSTSLEYPFAIQVCQEIFERILSLLQKSYHLDNIPAMISLLTILKGQFACLSKSEIDPTIVGFGYSSSSSSTTSSSSSSSSTSSNNLIDLGHNILSSLMKHSHSQLKIIAAETFSQGIQFFLPETKQKLSFTVSIMTEIFPLQSTHFELSQFIVLKTIIKKLSHCGEVLKMIYSFYDSPSNSNLVPELINFCLHLSVEMTLLNFPHTFFVNTPDFKISLYKLISSYQEQLMVDTISKDQPHLASKLCTDYLRNLCLNVDILLNHFQPLLCTNMEVFNPSLQDQINQSIIGRHFFPAIHGLCLSLHHIELVKDLSPYLIQTFEKVTKIALHSPSCQIAHKLFAKSHHKIQQKPVVVVEEVNGWRQIKAQFEDSQSDFAITEDGMVYQSVHSANTCAIVSCGFSGLCRAAWEFVLESDTVDDECAVFGAAHTPLTNRSYSASQNLYMRRAYNGHLYNRGRSVPSSLGKIHPGDIVRIEYDGRAETISYSVNGNELETCFTNVSGEIYPCCGSYRNNVRIRLLKVEIFGAASTTDEDDDSRSPEVVKWVTENPQYNPKDSSLLSFSKELPKQLETLEWLTGRGDRGALEGIHSWNFEVVEYSTQPLAFGIVFGETLSCDQPLAGCVEASRPFTQHHVVVPSTASAVATAAATTATSTFTTEMETNQEDIQNLLSCDIDEFLDTELQESFEFNDDIEEEPDLNGGESHHGGRVQSRHDLTLLPPPDFPSLDFPPCPTLSRTSTPADSPLPILYSRRRTSITSTQNAPQNSNTIRNVSPASELYVANRQHLPHNCVESIAWHSDGSLWVNGVKKSQSFGTEFLPFQKLSVIGIKVDRNVGTVSFFVNGVFVGIAFGPPSFSPSVTYSFPTSTNSHIGIFRKGGDISTCYPAASISSRSQSVRIMASGFHGSIVLPTLLSLQRTMASVIGRCLCNLIEGSPIGQSESQLSHWMKSPLLIGGLDDQVIKGQKFFESWEATWKRVQSSSPLSPSLTSPTSKQKIHSPDVIVTPEVDDVFDLQQHLFCDLDDTTFLQLFSKAWMDDYLSATQKKNCSLFLDWLDSLHSEPMALKATLLRSGTYSFPKCEYPVVACMLKHGILLKEAKHIFSLLESNLISTVEELPPHSSSMSAISSKIKQLRWHLRKQRQLVLSRVVTVDEEVKSDYPNDSSSSSYTEVTSRPSAIGKSIEWVNFLSTAICRHTTSTYICRALSMGFNYTENLICINVSINCKEEDLSLMRPDCSLLILNGVRLSFQSFEKIESKPTLISKQEIVGQMFFQNTTPVVLSTCLVKSIDLLFRFGTDEFTSVILISPEIESTSSNSNESVGQNSDKSSDVTQLTFDQLCLNISEKANFLMKIVPSSMSNFEDLDSNSNDIDTPASKLVSWRSDDSHEKWKTVAGVLKVQKKIRRQLSEVETPNVTQAADNPFLEEMIPDLDTNSDNEVDENPSYSQKSIQECLLFILSDTTPTSLVTLTEIIERRFQRGAYRSFGLDALNSVLQMKSIASDPTSITEIMFYFKFSLMAETSLGMDEEMHQRVTPLAHYFSSLEGCNRMMLTSVQSSFRSLYMTLSGILVQYVTIWKNMNTQICFQDTSSILKAIIVLLSCWSLHFPTSDHQFLFNSPLLSTLFELTSFSIYESAVADWFVASESFLEIVSRYGKSIPGYSNILRNWKPWSSSYVHKALRFGQLSCRNLLFHLFQVPPGLLSNEDKINLHIPIEKSFTELCLHYDVSTLSLLHENILGLFRNREHKRQQQFEKAQAAYLESRLAEEQAEKKRLRDAGVPLFDPTNQSGEIFMEDADQVAGVRNFQSSTKVATSYVELQYNLSTPQVERTGNYFEVTIIKSGMKDIGIGLGVLGVFPTSGEMPGWEPHSYGYHGDDGTKFGAGATPGRWPTWDDGDVIGCGIDFSRRTIFYTRNGVLLGDAFRNVIDDNLMPVVSFHSPNTLQKVRINFGLSEFVYKGDEIVINAAAKKVQEQHRTKASSAQTNDKIFTPSKEDSVFRRTETELKRALSEYGLPTHGARSELEIRLLGAYENQHDLFPSHRNEESKDDYPLEEQTKWCEKEYYSSYQRLTEATIHLEELINLRNYSGSLLRYLLSTSCCSLEFAPILTKESTSNNSQLVTSISKTCLEEIQIGANYLLEAYSRAKDRNQYLIVATPPINTSTQHVDMNFSNARIGMLEIHEIEYFLGKFIFSIYSLIQFSSTIKDLVLENNLQTFILLTRIGSPRLRRMVLNILSCSLPTILPAVVEKTILLPEQISIPKSKGSSPNTVIRMLLSIISDAISPSSKSINTSDKTDVIESFLTQSQVPIGYGRLLLSLGDHCISVLRQLLESPNWTDVVAQCLTDIFRSASTLIDSIISSNNKMLTESDFSTLLMATASCTVFSGLGIIRPGAKVTKNDGSIFSVISIQESTQRATICSSNIFHDTELVPLISIRPILIPMSIDISTLTQPLLEEFLLLMNKVLVWFQNNSRNEVNNISLDDFKTKSSLFRLSALLSSSFAVLYATSPTMFMNYLTPTLINTLIQASLDPILLKYSPTLCDVTFMWNFIQSRTLELYHGSIITTNQPSSSSNTASPAPVTENTQPSSRDYPNSIMIFSEDSIKQRMIVAEDFATELKLPVNLCLKRLDYYSGNKTAAVVSLLKNSTEYSFQPLPLSPTTTISDENAMRYIDHPSNFGGPTSDTSGRTLRVPDMCTLVRLTGSAENSPLPPGSLVLRSIDDGAYEVLPSNLFVCVTECETNDMITQYCDDELGIAFYCNIPRSESSLITSLYDHQIEDFPNLSISIDIVTATMRLRQLALSFIIDGKINILETNFREKIFLLLKFHLRNEASSVTPTRSLNFLSELCHNSTINKMDSQENNFNPLQLLLNDLTWNLSCLLESTTYTIPQFSREDQKYYECESAHPVEFGYENCGVFEIPESWRGALVVFDHRCSTDDASNSLSFYSSQEDFQNVKPLKKFWGKYGVEKSSFQSFLAPATSSSILTYRFTTAPIEKNFAMIASPPSENSHVFMGNCFIPEGVWYFEVQIISNNGEGDGEGEGKGEEGKELGDEIGDIRIGIMKKEENQQNESPVYINQESTIISGLTNVYSTSLGRMQSGDVISCTISINSQGCVIQFARNGVWSDVVPVHDSSLPIPTTTATTTPTIERFTQKYYPFYRISAGHSLEYNFGDKSFAFTPTSTFGDDWKPLNQSYQLILDAKYANNWGYSFQVRPLENLCCLIARDFELILKAQLEEGNEVDCLYFWRAKRISGYKNCGDIVTKDCRPPRGCVLIASDHCKPIKRYSKVFSSSKHNLTIWKPLPIDGYGCLGDIVTIGTSKPNASACSCVPLSTLKKSDVVHCLMKSKSKTSKGHQIASIWEVSNHMGHFFGSPTERRDFMRKTSEGQTCPAIPYTFKTNYLSTIMGEWTHEEDIISNQPSLQWSLFLCQFFLSHPEFQRYFVKEEMFQLLMRYLCSKNSPDNVAVLSVLIQMIRLSLKLNIGIGIGSISQTCKMILNTIYVKYKNEKQHFLNNNVFELVNFVSEAINDVNLFKSSLIPTSIMKLTNLSSDIEVILLPSLEKKPLSSIDLMTTTWSQLIISDPIREEYRLFSLSGADSILSNKPQMLRQLRDIRLFLNTLHSLTLVNNSSHQIIDFHDLPMELIFSSWNKHMKAVVFDESLHPYQVNQTQSYQKVFNFPGAKTISVCFDPRSHLHENSTLKISNGQNYLIILDSESLKQHLLSATIIQGSQLIIEFDVQMIDNNEKKTIDGLDNDDNNDDEYWGWGIVASADGPIYEGTSKLIDLNKVCNDSRQDEPLSLPTLCDPTTKGILNETELKFVKEKSRRIESGSLGIPFCHQLKLSIVFQKSLEASDSMKREYILEIIKPGKIILSLIFSFYLSDSVIDKSTQLLQIRDDTPPLLIDANIIDFILYSVNVATTPPPTTTMTTSATSSSPALPPQTLTMESSSNSENTKVIQGNEEIPKSTSLHRTPSSWICQLCTFCNEWPSIRCEICGADNPTRNLHAEEDGDNIIEAQENNPPSTADFAVWMCRQCTYMNQLDSVRCDMCGFNRSREIPRIGSPPDALMFENTTNPRQVEFLQVSESASDLDDEDDIENQSSSIPVMPPVLERGNLPSSLFSQFAGAAVGAAVAAALTPREPSSNLTPRETLKNPPHSKMGTVTTTDAPTPSSSSNKNTGNSILLNVDGIFTPSEKFETYLNQAILNQRWTPLHLRDTMMKWSSDADEILLDFMNQESDSDKLSTQHPFQWIITLKQMSHLTLTFSKLTLLDIQCRVMLLTAFNASLKHLLPIIDISNSDPHSLGYLVRQLNRYVLLSVKLPILQKSIESTMASGPGLPAHLNLDNFKATLSKDKMEIEPHQANNCFVQAFQQLHKFDSKIFRYIFNSDRVFQIHFEGESGIDAGGVFREGITRIVEDLFDITHFSFMILCPNGQHSVHLNMDKFIPNPQHNTPLALQMMEFVGKLMGMSLRAKLALPFNFPPIIWKKILGDPVTAEDLRSFDAITWSLLNTLRYCENDGIINQDLFHEKYEDKLKFTCTGCDGVEREIFPGGKDVSVTFETRIEYCDQVLKKRLEECDQQIHAIAKGMEAVVEMRVLHLFSWQQIEILVGGNPVFDIEMWKAHTESSLNAKTLELFWKVIESLSPKEQEGFVRFAWGRSRLPPAKEFTVKMKLTPRGSEKLPVAHTCFFSIEIPDYKTEDEMRHGILTAIHFGASGVLIG